MTMKQTIQRFRFSKLALVSAVVLVVCSGVAQAQCTLQLSDQGTIRMQSGEQRTLTWNPVAGASSYLVERLIEGLGDPAAPDFAFGAPYTESRNGEGKGLTSVRVQHSVLYKIRFRYIVTALNRDNPSFQPCKADVLYVIEADEQLASIASRRIVPIGGKARGANGSDYSTALIIAGTGLGTTGGNDSNKLYQGRVYFRPLGRTASADDPSFEYAIDGDETLVVDDVMARLGTTGIGTLEVIPRVGFPTPLVDAIIENRLSDGKRTGSRVPAAWGRDHLATFDSVTVGIRNMTDTRLAIGVRTLGAGGRMFFKHLASDGREIATAERFPGDDMTAVYSLHELFGASLSAGDRIIARYQGFQRPLPAGLSGSKGAILFLTETGNDINNPGIVYRDSIDAPRYSHGFDRFIVY